MDWYLNFSPGMTAVPTGYEKLAHIGAIGPNNLLSPAEIASLVQSAPVGSYWNVGGEPNALGITGSQFAEVFNYYFTNIEANDPTAKVTGPSVLNWDFTYIGCAGYQRGDIWTAEFIQVYQTTYGGLPPVDVWTIDVYPIDWTNTPNNDPAKPALYNGVSVEHWQIAVAQVQAMRQYLDTNGYADTPIWITELAVHVGYDGWKFSPFPQIVPDGFYHWELMSAYLNAVLDWLEQNAVSHKIERWFFFVAWRDIVNIGADGYMGVIFFDGPGQGAPLTCLGQVYRARSLGLPELTCDAEGSLPTPVPSATALGLAAMVALFAITAFTRTWWRSRRSRPAAPQKV